MRIQTAVRDRLLLVRFLEGELKQKAAYSGAPLFQYQVGKWTVLRDGELEVVDPGPRFLHNLFGGFFPDSML